ncbi:hypothetical protein KCP76_20300 [Salmonella enterica subsp. enterica serovar Weltevreden]|nr:hypothetical protein KCP76_20300 [Salmonella enterica subsp. enterica serovar Weltevreden]
MCPNSPAEEVKGHPVKPAGWGAKVLPGETDLRCPPAGVHPSRAWLSAAGRRRPRHQLFGPGLKMAVRYVLTDL